jgi:TolB-like protein
MGLKSSYKGKAVDLKQIGRELNVRYVRERRCGMDRNSAGRRGTNS